MTDDTTADEMTLEDLRNYHDRNCGLIAVVRRETGRMDIKKAELKDARGAVDKAVADLLAFGADDSLPFEQIGATDDGDRPAWRDIPLADGDEFAGLTAGLIIKLSNVQIKTAGDLADYTAEHGDFWGQDIPGVGPKAQETIEDACTAFWAAHPDAAEPEPADEPADDYDDDKQIAQRRGQLTTEPDDND